MGVRAYGKETLVSLPIDVDKDWGDHSISNVKSLQANEHITITARGANRNLHPSLNRYDSETDGWHISKDNNDIDRKFFKDDFSVVSADLYTVTGTVTGWGTGAIVLTNGSASAKRMIADPNSMISVTAKVDSYEDLDEVFFWINGTMRVRLRYSGAVFYLYLQHNYL
ncbi:MAG: hypothetical protein M0P69_16140, partial [Bacteroidales bacterium]|nr:hypothetical protein [Bacteroidales bacterium]